MYNDIYHHYGIIQSVFIALNTLCGYPSFTQALATTDLFTVSTDEPFLECHKVEIILYVAFSAIYI